MSKQSPVLSKRTYAHSDPDFEKNSIFDFHPTPVSFTKVLVDEIDLPHEIWEPACGEGHISKYLKERGHRVISSDLAPWGFGKTGVDFLRTKKAQARAIVTNPPSTTNGQFVIRCLDFLDEGEIDIAALIIRLEFIGSLWRHRDIWSRRMPTKIIAISNSMPNIHTGNNYSFLHAWFVWSNAKGRRGNLVIRTTTTDRKWE